MYMGKLFNRYALRSPALKLMVGLAIFLTSQSLLAQQEITKKDSAWKHAHKNIIRYNISGALLFGFDKYAIFGYERVVSPHQSFSVNFGGAALPKLISISTDSFNLNKNSKTSGYNFSVDYRFYLAHENKYIAPHGVYIGPYYSINHFTRENEWDYKNAGANSYVKTNSTFNINTVGIELGYQFIFWKRLSLDLVLIGPGIAGYDYKAKFESNIDAETKQQLIDGLKQLLTQKFPGMNFVFADKEINSSGVLKATSIGYRYLIHIGFNF